MIVAEITRDILFEGGGFETSQKGREFHYDAMRDWWGWPTDPDETLDLSEKTKFKLYDDDDELYYTGWLLNDDECIVQQFVLAWAQADSGCTSIMIEKNGEYVAEIG